MEHEHVEKEVARRSALLYLSIAIGAGLVFLLAASLGGVESLVVLPIYTSHYRMSRQELAAAGVAPGTVRVSVGLEDPADLIADLKQALA